MFKKVISLFLFIFFLIPLEVRAFYDPYSTTNNQFGIHIMSENDIPDAATLINSNGGDWGYITIVINETERNVGRWQNVFNSLRKNHLIPIIRVASKPNGAVWEKPSHEEIENWVKFFDSLNWVVKNRYIIIGNEPNHAKEWGGQINPKEYSDYLLNFSQKLKESNEDYFVLPAGLDASAPNSTATMDESRFLQGMLKANSNVFDYVDGWNSHSYPNPGFSAIPQKEGKISLKTYQWELSYLKSLGINKDLPVFITETGWSNEKLDDATIDEYFDYAVKNVWNDPKIVTVTPFILNYPDKPFDVFSFKKADGTYKNIFNIYKDVKKNEGKPIQEIKGRIIAVLVSPIEISKFSFSGLILAKNTGQSIWTSKNTNVTDESQSLELSLNTFDDIEPDKSRLIAFSGNSPADAGSYKIPLALYSQNIKIGDTYPFELFVIKNPIEVQQPSFFDKIKLLVKEFLGP